MQSGSFIPPLKRDLESERLRATITELSLFSLFVCELFSERKKKHFNGKERNKNTEGRKISL